jgi:hypothetical protein
MSAGMDAQQAQRIETIASVAAAAILAAAVAFAVSRFSSMVASAAAAGGALFIALQVLRSLEPRTGDFSLAEFAPAELDFEELDELPLTEADLLDHAEQFGADELVLDDILANLGEDSRVVRLFDASAMPTPGQLRARIDRHLGQTKPDGLPDASAALHDALAELRLSLK